MLRFLCVMLFFSNSKIKIIKTEEVVSTTTSSNLLMESTTDLILNTSTSTLVNLPTTISSFINNLQDIETTSSWELIYPDQNSTTTEEPLVNNVNHLQMTNASVTTTQSTLENLPKYFKVDDVLNCQKYFGACLRQVLANVLPKLKNGSHSLQIPSLDPIYFNQTAFQFNNGPFTGHITMRYARIYGLTAMKFTKIDYFSMANNKFKARLWITVPKMKVFGSYKGDLVVNNLGVRPKGNFNITMLDLHLNVLCLGESYQKDEHTFLKFTKNNVTANFKDSKINATGIFPDQRLNEVVVNVANQYWRELFNIVIPETRRYWSPILMDALNGALAMVPFDFLK